MRTIADPGPRTAVERVASAIISTVSHTSTILRKAKPTAAGKPLTLMGSSGRGIPPRNKTTHADLPRTRRRKPPLSVLTACAFLLVFALVALVACSLPFEREVLIHADGRDRLGRTAAPTVGAALTAMGITLGPSDRVVPPPDQPVSQGMRISVLRVVEQTQEVTETIAVQTEVIADHTAADGLIVSAYPGATGVQRVTYRTYLEDGVPVRREVAARQVLTPAIPASLTVGDRPTPQIDAFEAAARGVLSQPGASRLSRAQIEETLGELAKKQPSSQVKVLHREGAFPLTLVSFASSGDKPLIIAFWWPERPLSVSQRLVEGAHLADTRLVDAGQAWELGLITGSAGETTPGFWLFRLAGPRWAPVWNSGQSTSWSSGAGLAAFGDDGLTHLVVAEQVQSSPSTVFLECSACAHRETRSLWTRQGDSYELVQRIAMGSPYTVLWTFLDRLRRGDENGARALCADSTVVPLATGLGLDIPGAAWTTASRPGDLTIDFAGPAGSFRATLVARGRTWRLAGVERASSEGRILMTESSRGAARRIISLHPDRGEPVFLQQGTHYAWSPDYRRVAYDSNGQVCTIGADSADSTCVVDGASPVWSPQGDRLVVERAGAGGSVIWLVSVDGSTAKPLAAGESPSWSPDGARIAFSVRSAPSQHMSIFLMAPEGGSQTLFTTDGRLPAWSADGRLLAFITSGHVIVAVDTAGNVITPVGSGLLFRWSPRGHHIALVDGGRLLVAKVGAAPRQIVPWEDVVSVSWSPDGDRLAVGRSNHELWLVGRDGADARKLADGDGPVWASGP